MNILALDTCTEMCSAALVFNGQVYEKSELTQRGHSEKILGMMQSVLDEAACSLQQIDAIAFGRGPGSFTGVRIGVGVAQGVAFARELPVAAVSTLAAVAQYAMDKHDVERVAVAMDARMGEIYAAHFIRDNDIAMVVDNEQVCKPEYFKPMDDDKWFAAGSGWREFESELMANFGQLLEDVDVNCLPQASCILKLALTMAEKQQLVPAEQALPVYLRDNVAKKKGEQ